ncbi:MAG: zinc-ribbon domain-containing protein [Pseudomonadota bacterium]
MRIQCPKCVAQYEVDDQAIPDDGREVQCANCDHVWFQDRLEMLPDRPAPKEPTAEAGIFAGIETSETPFQSARAGTTSSADEPDVADATEEDDLDLLAEEDARSDDAEEMGETPAQASLPPVDEDVAELMRSEAAFSSARAQLDNAAALALDAGLGRDDAETDAGDLTARLGAALPEAAEESASVTHTDDNADNGTDDDALAAFLDAHDTSGDPAEDVAVDPEEISQAEDSVEDAEEKEDPLADLAAIRAQLGSIGVENAADTASEPAESAYRSMVPADDPPPALDLTGDDADEVEEEDYDELAPETNGPRHAFRADGAKDPDDDGDVAAEGDEDLSFYDPHPDRAVDEDAAIDPDANDDTQGASSDTNDVDDLDTELDRYLDRATEIDANEATPNDRPAQKPEPAREPKPALDGAGIATAAVAGGASLAMTRPRAKGVRARNLLDPGGTAPAPAPDTPPSPRPPRDDAPKDIAPDVEEVVPARSPAGGLERPEGRKALLPDVEELNDSLRDSPDEPRRRDRELMAEAEADATRRGGGFVRALAWTLLILGVLLAAYVLRPQIVAALPAAAAVLDPYAATIDRLRLLIDGLIS